MTELPRLLSKVNSKCYAPLSLVFATVFANFSECEQMLARKFHETHDLAVKDELERWLKEYGKLGEPWSLG